MPDWSSEKQCHQKGLFLLFEQPSFDSFARRRLQRLGWQAWFTFIVLMGHGTQKPYLLPVPPTPLAEQQMNAKPDTLPQCKPVIERLGLQSRGLATTG